eukprot:Awhi_evm1s7571
MFSAMYFHKPKEEHAYVNKNKEKSPPLGRYRCCNGKCCNFKGSRSIESLNFVKSPSPCSNINHTAIRKSVLKSEPCLTSDGQTECIRNVDINRRKRKESGERCACNDREHNSRSNGRCNYCAKVLKRISLQMMSSTDVMNIDSDGDSASVDIVDADNDNDDDEILLSHPCYLKPVYDSLVEKRLCQYSPFFRNMTNTQRIKDIQKVKEKARDYKTNFNCQFVITKGMDLVILPLPGHKKESTTTIYASSASLTIGPIPLKDLKYRREHIAEGAGLHFIEVENEQHQKIEYLLVSKLINDAHKASTLEQFKRVGNHPLSVGTRY